MIHHAAIFALYFRKQLRQFWIETFTLSLPPSAELPVNYSCPHTNLETLSTFFFLRTLALRPKMKHHHASLKT